MLSTKSFEDLWSVIDVITNKRIVCRHFQQATAHHLIATDYIIWLKPVGETVNFARLTKTAMV